MNYRHVYMLIIEHAKSEEKLGLRKKGNGNYYERHHILPKSLFPLWSKRKSNLVLLTAREHFFCHQLLTKIYSVPEMVVALFYLSNDHQNNTKMSSKEYATLREQHYLAQVEMWNNRDDSFKNTFKATASERMKKIWDNRTDDERHNIGRKAYQNRSNKENCTDAMILARRQNKKEISKKISDAWETKFEDKEKLSKRCKSWNTNRDIINKRSETLKRIKQEQVNDPNNELRNRLTYYNELKKIKILCIETGVIYPSRNAADKTVGHLKINTAKGILSCEKVIDGKVFHFEVVS